VKVGCLVDVKKKHINFLKAGGGSLNPSLNCMQLQSMPIGSELELVVFLLITSLNNYLNQQLGVS
jgi:hypothetical protein